MRQYRHMHWIAAVCVAVFTATCVLAQTQITNPDNGRTVRGVVRVNATKSDPRNGWISYKFTGPDQSGDFTVALIHPYGFEWDTNTLNMEGERVYPDGEYTVTAVGYSPSGQQVGQDSVRMTVSNDMSASESPGAVKLQTDYKRATVMNVEAMGTAQAKLKEHNDTHAEIIKAFNGTLKAHWRERAMSNSAGGMAIVRKYFDRGYTLFEKTRPTNLPLAGEIFTLLVMPDASIQLKHDDEEPFPLGELYIELPDRTLRKGSTWRSDMYVLPMLRASERRSVQGHHRLDGFQWASGFKCVRIVSTFSEEDVEIKLRMGEPKQQERSPEMGPGMEPGMGPGGPGLPGEMGVMADGPMPEDEMMMPEGGMPGGAGGGVGAGVPPVATVTTSYEGTRTSYFAYEFGQFVRAEDKITHTLTIDTAKFGSAAGRGMMGEEGMMGPGMEPGMGWGPEMEMEPGMGPEGAPPEMMEPPPGEQPYGPGMEPGMGPGMEGPGRGMARQQPVEKEFEATQKVELSIQKRR